MEMAKLEKKQKTIEVIFVFCKSQLMCKKLEGNRFTEWRRERQTHFDWSDVSAVCCVHYQHFSVVSRQHATWSLVADMQEQLQLELSKVIHRRPPSILFPVFFLPLASVDL